MKMSNGSIGLGLVLVAVGAMLAWAVNATGTGLDIKVVSAVLLVVWNVFMADGAILALEVDVNDPRYYGYRSPSTSPSLRGKPNDALDSDRLEHTVERLGDPSVERMGIAKRGSSEASTAAMVLARIRSNSARRSVAVARGWQPDTSQNRLIRLHSSRRVLPTRRYLARPCLSPWLDSWHRRVRRL